MAHSSASRHGNDEYSGKQAGTDGPHDHETSHDLVGFRQQQISQSTATLTKADDQSRQPPPPHVLQSQTRCMGAQPDDRPACG